MAKYNGNDLLDFLMANPMELREFMDEHMKLNPITKLIVRIRAALFG